MKIYRLNRQKQAGATLVVALIALIVLMILGVAGVITANTQLKMAGNLQFENLAKNRAENQIASAEQFLMANGGGVGGSLHAGFTTWSAASKELHPIGHFASLGIANNDPLNMSATQWQDNSSLSLANTDGYMIELFALGVVSRDDSAVVGSGMNMCNSLNVFRITGRGLAGRGATRFVQSFFSVVEKSFNC